MTARENVLDCPLVALHRIHHERVFVQQPQHRHDLLVAYIQEQYFTVDLIERDEVFTEESG